MNPTLTEVPAVVPLEQAKPLKLSEAMRLATMQQAFGDFKKGGARCAIASAADVLGVDFSQLALLSGRKPIVPMPCGHESSAVWDSIIHLNDEHKLTRAQVADWLESNGL